MNKLFYSLITLAIALVFLMIGIVCVLIPWSPEVRSGLTTFINEDSAIISLFGLAFLIVAAAIIANILINTKRSYYHIYSGPHSLSIDENAIQQLLQTYWQQKFPGKDIPSRITLKNNLIHITADLPYLPNVEQTTTLEKIRQDLQETFANILGYNSEFFLSISFQPPPPLAIPKSK